MKNSIKNIFSLLLSTILFLSSCSKTEITTSLPEINAENNKSVGASANDLLSSTKYNTLKVEIQYMPGFQPDAASISNLNSFINSLVNKPNGVVITQTQIPASGKTSLTLNEIASIEQTNRTAITSGNQIVVYFLFTDANYSQANVLGIAYRNTSLCLMGKTIKENSGGIGQTSKTKLETTVLQHELAHVLGLVDNGSSMQTNHKDAAHGSHCNNSNCLMYYSTETTDVLGFLIAGNVPTLDANCRADLTANGGK
jgi:hypothetical protein